jgi:hypothetical protein
VVTGQEIVVYTSVVSYSVATDVVPLAGSLITNPIRSGTDFCVCVYVNPPSQVSWERSAEVNPSKKKETVR